MVLLYNKVSGAISVVLVDRNVSVGLRVVIPAARTLICCQKLVVATGNLVLSKVLKKTSVIIFFYCLYKFLVVFWSGILNLLCLSENKFDQSLVFFMLFSLSFIFGFGILNLLCLSKQI